MDTSLAVDGVDRSALRSNLLASMVQSKSDMGVHVDAMTPDLQAETQEDEGRAKEEQVIAVNVAHAMARMQGAEQELDVLGPLDELSYSVSPMSTAESTWKFIYEAFVTVFVVYNCLEIPFRLAFQPQSTHAFYIVAALVDTIFVIDLVIRFFLPYVHEEGYFVKNLALIRTHYLRTWFVPDAISSIPWDLIQLCYSSATGTNLDSGSDQWFRYVRLTRMLRLISISMRLREWEVTLDWDINAVFFRMVRVILGLVIYLNGMACIWWLIADAERSKYSWVLDDILFNNLTYAPIWEQYLASLYWTVITFTTIGYGDATPTTAGERAFFIPMALLSIVIMSYALGTVVAWMQANEVKRADLGDTLTFVKRYAKYRSLAPRVTAKLLRYFRFKGMNNVFERDDSELMQEFTPILRAEVALHFKRTLLAQWELAQYCEKVFLTALVLRMRREVKVPGEYICVQGSSSSKFSVLVSGSALVIRDGVVIAEVSKPGLTVGEPALFKPFKRPSSVRARTTCELLTITQKDIVALRKLFPEYERFLDEYAQGLTASLVQKDKNLRGERTETSTRRTDGGPGFLKNLWKGFRGRHARTPSIIIDAPSDSDTGSGKSTGRSDDNDYSSDDEDDDNSKGALADSLMRAALPELPLITFDIKKFPALDDPKALAAQMATDLHSSNHALNEFLGKEAMQYLMSNFRINDDNALYLCKRLLRAGLLRPRDGPILEFEPNETVYKFQVSIQRLVLGRERQSEANRSKLGPRLLPLGRRSHREKERAPAPTLGFGQDRPVASKSTTYPSPPENREPPIDDTSVKISKPPLFEDVADLVTTQDISTGDPESTAPIPSSWSPRPSLAQVQPWQMLSLDSGLVPLTNDVENEESDEVDLIQASGGGWRVEPKKTGKKKDKSPE